MADNWTQSVVCRYFKNGMCREGNNCRYRHVNVIRQDTSENDTNTSNVSTYNVACLYFKQGKCRFGNQCHFRHSNETTGSISSQRNQSGTPSTVCHITDNSNVEPSIKSEHKDWATAPEFFPPSPLIAASSSSANETSGTLATTNDSWKPASYAQAVHACSGPASDPASEPLCPFAEATGICKMVSCIYLHGEICELCNRPALHPHNEELRKKHINACVKQHEADMELSFAIARSREKSCGVCFETIMEKSSREQRFGILPNCNHCFCLTCIRKWRQAKQFDNKIIRACPECRVTSDFVCPSMYWVETKEEKQKLIDDYKVALSTKDCKYFKKGHGKCPFGNKCFYLHELPNGTKLDVGPPIRHRRNADAEFDILDQLILWDFLEDRADRFTYEDFMPIASDSEDSDWSEYDFAGIE